MKKRHLAATALACMAVTMLMVGATVAPQDVQTNPMTTINADAVAQSTIAVAYEETVDVSTIIEQAGAEAETESATAQEKSTAATSSHKNSQPTSSSKNTSSASNKSGKSSNSASTKSSSSTRTITIDGVTMSYSDSYGTSSAPSSGAGIWKGSDSTTDGSYSYYIGHNPGSFSAAASADLGSKVTVNDSDGNSRTYTVVDTFVVSRDSTWGDVSDRVANHGESVALQTCVSDGYKIIVAS